MSLFRKFIETFVIGILCLTGLFCQAQQSKPAFKPDQYRAINWTDDDGVYLHENYLIKDKKGFLWVGPKWEALTRFDGARFKKYFADTLQRGMIKFGGINSFVEDSLNNIWIGTINGLARYDIQTDTFTNFYSGYGPLNKDRSIVPFWCTSNDIYCLESGNLVVRYNIHSFEKKRLLTLKDDQKNLISFASKTIYDSISNSLWIQEWMSPENPTGGLMQIYLEDGRVKHYGWPCFRHLPNHNHAFEAMKYDKKRNVIWINSPDGLLTFFLENKRFELAEGFEKIIIPKEYGRYVGIDMDRDGRIWLATHPDGILIYDPETKEVNPLFSDSVLQNKTGENNFQIYCDPDGIVWSTYWDARGIYELLPYHPAVTLYPAKKGLKNSWSQDYLMSIVPAGTNQIWVGTRDGLNIFNSNTGKIDVIRKKDLSGLTRNDILPFFIDTINKRALLTNSDGDSLFEMNMLNRVCRLVRFRDGLKIFDSIQIETPPFSLPFKKGLLVYDMKHGFFEVREDSSYADLVIPFISPSDGGYIGRAVLVQNRFLFLKTPDYPPNYSFEYVSGKWIRSDHLFDSLDWNSMYYNPGDQTTWTAIGNKLLLFDRDFRQIKSYPGEKDNDQYIVNMLTDDSGNVWHINSGKKLSRLNIRTGIVNTLSTSDGYQPQSFDWSSAGAKDIQGNLYFAESGLGTGDKGIIQIKPEKYISSNPARVYFNALYINYKIFPLSVGVNTIDELILQHEQSNIGIETGIIDYFSMGRGHLRYKLEGEGREEDWQYSPAYYTVRYEGLQPGKYTLHMQASGAGNEFNGPEKLLQITIRPPWWKTWWARLLFILAAVFSLWSFIQYRSRNLKQRNAALEEKVILRTRELKHSLEDLRGAQAKLIQREKMASLGELTAGIAHEIQNPLNFVNNFSDVNTELIEELKTEQKKPNRDFKNEEELLNDIGQNELKINHHGKRADAIVKGMLQHSRTSTGQKELTDINALTDEYLRLSYHGLRAKDKSFNAAIHTDFDSTIKEISVIPQDIGRVLLNIFNNAFYSVEKKQKEGAENFEPVVSVSTKNLEGKIEIKVRDNGMGIPQKVLEKIYQPFFTTKPPGEGTGLGLSLSYDIITKVHSGELKVDTKEGEFAEFTVQLPI